MDTSSNPISFPFVTTALAVVFALFLIKFLSNRKKPKEKLAPIGGTIFQLIYHFHRIHEYVVEIAKKHKTFRLILPFYSEVHVIDPINVEYILKTNFANYGKGWFHYEILSDLLGDGIFTVDGDQWKHQRKTASYEFSTKILRDFSSEVFRRNIAKLAQIIYKAATNNQSIEIQELFMNSTLDSVFKVILGVELDSMCGSNEEGKIFTDAFNEASAITVHRYIDFSWKIKRFLNIGAEGRLKKCVRIVDKYVYKLINAKIENVNKSQHNVHSAKKGDILSRFLESNETDPKYLKDIILSFIIAGKDTTASTLSWFLYMMCKHPEIQEKVAQDVWEATNMKPDSSFDEIADSITEEAIEKMKYLHAALTETLRLYPSVPTDKKQCFADDTLPDGYTVKKGQQVGYQPYVMGRMKWIWGDDAEEYRPERWFNQDGVFQQESTFKFTAFQAGPRICLGKEFAYRQMKIYLAVLIGSFKFKVSEEQKRVVYKTMLTLHIDGGLYLRATPRTSFKTI